MNNKINLHHLKEVFNNNNNINNPKIIQKNYKIKLKLLNNN